MDNVKDLSLYKETQELVELSNGEMDSILLQSKVQWTKEELEDVLEFMGRVDRGEI